MAQVWHQRKRSDGGLPYLIGADYLRLQRLVREYKHERWYGCCSYCMLEGQVRRLYSRLYGKALTWFN